MAKASQPTAAMLQPSWIEMQKVLYNSNSRHSLESQQALRLPSKLSKIILVALHVSSGRPTKLMMKHRLCILLPRHRRLPGMHQSIFNLVFTAKFGFWPIFLEMD
jgi:hypothetical protein